MNSRNRFLNELVSRTISDLLCILIIYAIHDYIDIVETTVEIPIDIFITDILKLSSSFDWDFSKVITTWGLIETEH